MIGFFFKQLLPQHNKHQLMEERVNLDSPKWDQSTYIGRAKHFFAATNPLNVFATPSDLEHAKDIVERHRKVQLSSKNFPYKQNISYHILYV